MARFQRQAAHEGAFVPKRRRMTVSALRDRLESHQVPAYLAAVGIGALAATLSGGTQRLEAGVNPPWP